MNNLRNGLTVPSNTIPIIAQILINYEPFCNTVTKIVQKYYQLNDNNQKSTLFYILYDIIMQHREKNSNIDLNPLIHEYGKDPQNPLTIEKYYTYLIESLEASSQFDNNIRDILICESDDSSGNNRIPFFEDGMNGFFRITYFQKKMKLPELLFIKITPIEDGSTKYMEKIESNKKKFEIYSIICDDTNNKYKLFMKINNVWYFYVDNEMNKYNEANNFNDIIFQNKSKLKFVVYKKVK